MNTFVIPIYAKITIFILSVIIASFICTEAGTPALCRAITVSFLVSLYTIIEAIVFLFLLLYLVVFLAFQDVDKKFINFVISLFLSILVSFFFFVAVV
ncbi:MAG: hypothetical protein AB4063_04100 [Crocosphaera sp.]